MSTRWSAPLGARTAIAATTLALTVGSSVLAQEKEFDRNTRLTYDGVVYEYKAIPRWDNNGKFMYHTGQISGWHRVGELEFFQKTQQSPGCDMDFPAISLVDVPHQNSGHKKTFVLFCGSYAGRHNSLRFYSPNVGIVSSFDLGNFTPVIDKNDNSLELTYYREIWPKSISSKFSYPTIYDIFHDGYSVNLVKKNNADERTKLKYRRLLGKIDGTVPRDRIVAENLIIFSMIDDQYNYCNIAKTINNGKIIEEIEALIDFPMIKCKET